MRRQGSQRGQALILVVGLMVLLMAGGALAVDTGVAYVYREKCDNVVEAAALAAASQLPDLSAANAAADSVIQANGLDPARMAFTPQYDGHPGRIQVSYSSPQQTFFAKALGINAFEVNAAGVAEMAGGADAVFDYSLFSGSETVRLDMTGINVGITGHVHGNQNIRIRGANVDVSGRIEATQDYSAQGSSVHAGSIEEYAAFVPMPEWSVDELREMCATRYSGSQHWSGENINVDGGVFVQGDLHLSGVNITGSGVLVATGDIHLSGTNLRYLGASDRVCMYSLGDIRVTGTNLTVDGILYAPNGAFDGHGANLTVNGAIIADTVDLSGANLHINYDRDAIGATPGGGRGRARLIRH